MAETNKKEGSSMCDCTTNGGMILQRHMIHRMIFVLLVVMLAFWCGLKLGEIKGFISANYGGYGMRQRNMMLYDVSDRPMMVEKKVALPTEEAPAPAATTAPTVE